LQKESDEEVMRKKPENICSGINIRPYSSVFRDFFCHNTVLHVSHPADQQALVT